MFGGGGGGIILLRIVLFLNFSRNGLKYWSIVYFSATKLQGYASDAPRWTFSLLGHTPWNGALHKLLPILPYHPVSVLNTTSRWSFGMLPQNFFNFNFRPHNDILGLFLNFLLFKLSKTPMLVMSISILGVLITSLV